MSAINLKDIFNAITPENIKDIPLIKNAMDIFIQQLEENSRISIDIGNVWDNISNKVVVGGREVESEMLSNSKDNLRDLILKTYTSVLYNTIKDAQTNKPLYDIFERDGLITSPLNGNISDIINDEYFYSNKHFNELVGTKKGLAYAYNLCQYLENRETKNDLEVESPEPFIYDIRGGVYHETFESVMKPLTHPLGFIYNYSQLYYLHLNDRYGFTDTYNFKSIEVRQIDGYFYVFTPDDNDDVVKSVFLTNRINPTTNEIYTLQEYNNLVRVYTNKVVISYTPETLNLKQEILRFSDGTCLIKYTDYTDVAYCQYNEYLADIDDPVRIRNFSDHASLYIVYVKDIEFEYNDEMSFESMPVNYDDVNIVDNITDSDVTSERLVQNGHYLGFDNGETYITTIDGFYLYVYEND